MTLIVGNRGSRNGRPIVRNAILALSDKWLSLDTSPMDEQIISQMSFNHFGQVDIWFWISVDAMLLVGRTSAQISQQCLGKIYLKYNSLPPYQKIDISCHKLSQNGHFVSKAAFTQGAVLLQRSAAAAWPFTQGAVCERQRRGCQNANGLKGAFTQGIVSPAGGSVPKRAQRRRKLAQGPNLQHAAKLPPASVKMPVEINSIQLHEPRIFYLSGHWPETVTNSHVSAHFR